MNTDLELINLEELLSDGCKCESTHTHSECTLEVLYVTVAPGCHPDRKVCQGAVDGYNRFAMCNTCMTPWRSHWTIRPI
jgi:hypothetical protein